MVTPAPIMAETYPNRFYQHAAQTDRIHNSTTVSTLPTIWDHLAAAGLTGRYYFYDVPFTALCGTKYLSISHPFSQFLTDCATGSDSSACCGEGPGPNTPLPGITGLGGGRVGALVVSPRFVTPGTWSDTPYNHYSLLASVEDLFGLAHLGYADAPALPRFGLDVYNRGV